MTLQELEKKHNQLVSRNKQLVYQLTCQQHYLAETATCLHKQVAMSCDVVSWDSPYSYPTVIKQMVEVLEQLQSRLGCYEQRLSLAAGRVATVHASLIHRRALQSSRIDHRFVVLMYNRGSPKFCMLFLVWHHRVRSSWRQLVGIVIG